MQHGNQPFWARLQLLARLMLNAGKHAGNQPARLAHPSDEMICWPVSPRVGNVKNNDPSLIEPIAAA